MKKEASATGGFGGRHLRQIERARLFRSFLSFFSLLVNYLLFRPQDGVAVNFGHGVSSVRRAFGLSRRAPAQRMTAILVPGPGRVGRRSGPGGGAPNILVTGSGRVGRRSGPWGRAPNYLASSLARSCPPFQWLLPPKVSLWLESKPSSPEPACCSPRRPTTDSGKPPRQKS